MDEAKILVWARTHKKEVVAKTLGKAVPKESPIAVVMAGIPGAGKTEFVNRIVLAESDLKDAVVIDLDKIVENFPGYVQSEYYKYRKAASILLDAILDACLKRRLDFVLDGTFAHRKGAENVRRALDKGYEVNLFLINQAVDISWEITKARRMLTGRPVEQKGFWSAVEGLTPNICDVMDKYGSNSRFLMSVIKKDDLNRYSYIEDYGEIEKCLKVMYNSYKKKVDYE